MTDKERAQLEQEKKNLEQDLSSVVSPIGDWKIAKYNEYILAGLEAPYDIKELNRQREAVRVRIREIDEILSM